MRSLSWEGSGHVLCVFGERFLQHCRGRVVAAGGTDGGSDAEEHAACRQRGRWPRLLRGSRGSSRQFVL